MHHHEHGDNNFDRNQSPRHDSSPKQPVRNKSRSERSAKMRHPRDGDDHRNNDSGDESGDGGAAAAASLLERLKEALKEPPPPPSSSSPPAPPAYTIPATMSITDERQYQRLADRCEYKTYKDREYICRSGEGTTPALYIVVEGKARMKDMKSGGSSNDLSWLLPKDDDAGNDSFNNSMNMSFNNSEAMHMSMPALGSTASGSGAVGRSRRTSVSARAGSGKFKQRSSSKSVKAFGRELLYNAEFRKTKTGKLVQNLIIAPYSVQAVGEHGCTCAVITAYAFREACHVGKDGELGMDDAPRTPKSPMKKKVSVPTTPTTPKTPQRPKIPKSPTKTPKKTPSHHPKSPSKSSSHSDEHRRGKSKHKDHVGEERPKPPPFNIFQEDLHGSISDFVRPVYPKTEKEQQVISRALNEKTMMKHLPEETKENLALALEKAQVQAGMVIVKQGDTDDYYYVVSKGECEYEVNGVKHTQKEGDSFGEEALLGTRAPRRTSVTAKSDVEVFRVDSKTYRRLLEKDIREDREHKLDLLHRAGFLENVTAEKMEKLVDIMEMKKFKKGEHVCRKENCDKTFVIVDEGEVVCRNVSSKIMGDMDDYKLGPGEHIGMQNLVEIRNPIRAEVVGKKDGIVYEIHQNQYMKAIGTYLDLVPVEDKVLSGIRALQQTEGEFLPQEDILKISNFIHNKTYKPGAVICEAGVEMEAALYFVRKGDAISTKACGSRGSRFPTTFNNGSCFGEEMFMEARLYETTTVVSKYELVAGPKHKCVVGILLLSDYLNAMSDTADNEHLKNVKKSSDPKKQAGREHKWPKCNIALNELERHVILGQGHFGQVWLVSDKTGKKIKKPCVLKIQSKHGLIEKGKVSVCIEEKHLLQKLHCPFIVDLVNAYQDKGFVYMLLEFLNGGELYNIMNPWEPVVLPESQAKFYILAIADALAYIHSKRIIFRDLKPENVLIDKRGYPKLIDFGFAKQIESKTFTLCGTPGYLAPEVVLMVGHNQSVDHWQLGILLYDMLSLDSAFFDDDMDKMEQYRTVVEDPVPEIEGPVTPEAWDLILRLLEKDPKHRLGSLKHGERDILNHKWFKEVSLSDLRKRALDAPWVPDVKDPYDTSNFEDWTDLDDITAGPCPELTPEQAAMFDSF